MRLVSEVALAVSSLGCLASTVSAGALAIQPARPAAQQNSDGLSPVLDCRVEGPFWDERWTACAGLLDELFAALEEGGFLANFDLVSGALEAGQHNGQVDADAHVYRTLEGVALLARARGETKIDERASALVDRILAAQREDGYLHTASQCTERVRPFRDVRKGRELYCAGELIRAGLALQRAFGDERLLDGARRLAALLAEKFGEEGRGDPPGHQGLESALTRLARATGDESLRELAAFLIEQRGQDYGRTRMWGPEVQDSQPVLGQRTAVGDPLRALNMFTAVAEIARDTRWEDYWKASLTFWDDVFRRKSYIHGGVGVVEAGFGEEFALPHELALCAPDAATAMAEWNHGLALLAGHATFADLYERVLFNNVLASLAVDGRSVAQRNPLASSEPLERVPVGQALGAATHLARFLPSVSDHVYATYKDEIYVLQYLPSRATVELSSGTVTIVQETDYPIGNTIKLTFQCDKIVPFRLFVRVPGWCRDWVTLGPAETITTQRVTHGHDPGTWLNYHRRWTPGSTFSISFPLFMERERAPQEREACRGRVALRRGPLVYAFEGSDHANKLESVVVPKQAVLPYEAGEGALGGAPVCKLRGFQWNADASENALVPTDLTAIPYYLWGARGSTTLGVWMPEREGFARQPGEVQPLRQYGAVVRASHVGKSATLAALNDQRAPKKKSEIDPDLTKEQREALAEAERKMPRFTFASHKGTKEWVRYDFNEAQEFKGAEVYWHEDGVCAVPNSWKLQWLDRDRWRDVELNVSRYETAKGKFNKVHFTPITTRSLKLEVQLEDGASAGILEWRVNRVPR